MAVGIYFGAGSFTPAQYDEAIQRLEAAGASAPAGRTYHTSFLAGPNVHIFDVWDSTDAFEAFGATLMPILAEVGANPGEPTIAEIHNVIIG
jgi:hypothetical protein